MLISLKFLIYDYSHYPILEFLEPVLRVADEHEGLTSVVEFRSETHTPYSILSTTSEVGEGVFESRKLGLKLHEELLLDKLTGHLHCRVNNVNLVLHPSTDAERRHKEFALHHQYTSVVEGT